MSSSRIGVRPSLGARPGPAGRIGPIAVALVGTVGALALDQRLWPTPHGATTPPSSVLPFFIGLEAVACLVFGLGLAFLAFGYGAVARARQPLWLTYSTYLSIAWLLIGWWPHGNLHRVTVPGDWTRLLAIDYGFHLTLMAAAGIVALFFLRTLRGPTS